MSPVHHALFFLSNSKGMYRLETVPNLGDFEVKSEPAKRKIFTGTVVTDDTKRLLYQLPMGHVVSLQQNNPHLVRIAAENDKLEFEIG